MESSIQTNEGTISITQLHASMSELEALWQQLDDAKLLYNAAIDAVSQATGVNKKILRQLVSAIKSEKVDECANDAQNLADLLEALTS